MPTGEKCFRFVWVRGYFDSGRVLWSEMLTCNLVPKFAEIIWNHIQLNHDQLEGMELHFCRVLYGAFAERGAISLCVITSKYCVNM